MRKIVCFLVAVGVGFLLCYTLLINPEWYKGLGFGNVKFFSTDCEKVIKEIEKYDWDTKVATAVMKAESKCDTEIKGDTDLVFEENGREYGYSVGAFQIRILPGREECDTYELEKNVECAYNIYLNKGRTFTDWSMFLNGKYKEFLEET